ncbi:unnamed protein product, partial [Callosobruchus maculatus]
MLVSCSKRCSFVIDLIYSLQQMCVLLEQYVESICVSGSNVKDEPIEFGSKNVRLELQQLVKACEHAVKIAQNLNSEKPVSCTITHK